MAVNINGEMVDIEPGERLLDAARRNALHIGFVCDGNGLCQMCECLVQRGGEHLSPLTEAETMWLTQWQIDQGRRLACQASVRGPGQVEILTRAEELRQQTNDVFNPPQKDQQQSYLNTWFNSLMTVNIEHIKRFPMNMVYAMVQMFTLRPTFHSARQVVVDALRISQRVATGRAPENGYTALPASSSGRSSPRASLPPEMEPAQERPSDRSEPSSGSPGATQRQSRRSRS
jgi:ferredoxin